MCRKCTHLDAPMVCRMSPANIFLPLTGLVDAQHTDLFIVFWKMIAKRLEPINTIN